MMTQHAPHTIPNSPLSLKLERLMSQEQPSPAWEAHTYMGYGSPGSVPNQICLYGVPQSLEQYADQAQIANYVQYRYMRPPWPHHFSVRPDPA